MNKQELLNKIKSQFYFYELSINKEIPSVYFETWTKEARSNCYVEIPFINNKEKEEIYKLIDNLINGFDFSFRTTFESKEEINKFLRGV